MLNEAKTLIEDGPITAGKIAVGRIPFDAMLAPSFPARQQTLIEDGVIWATKIPSKSILTIPLPVQETE